MRIRWNLLILLILGISCGWTDEINLWSPATTYRFPTVTFQEKILIQGEVKADVDIKSVVAHIGNAKGEKEALTCSLYYLDGNNKKQAIFKTEGAMQSPNSVLTVEVIHDNKSVYQQTFFVPMGCTTSRYGDFAEITTAQIHNDVVRSVQFSEDNKYLVTASDDSTIKILDAYTLKTIKTFRGHLGSARQALITRDNKTVVSCSIDKTIKVWDVASEKCVHTFYDREFPVHSIALSPNEKYLASGSRYILMWNLPERRFVRKLTLSYFMDMRPLVFSPDGKRLFSGDDRGSVKIWQAYDSYYDLSRYHDATITGITVCSSNRYLFTADSKGYIKWWMLLTDTSNSAWEGEEKMWELRVNFGKGDDQANVGDSGDFFDKVKRYPVYFVTDEDAGDTEQPYSSFDQGGAIVGLQLNSTGEFLMLATRDGEVRIHETATANSKWSTTLNKVLSCAAFAPNGSLVAVAEASGKIRVYGIQP